jgi:hypothetical protein
MGTRARDHHEARTCSEKIERYLDSVDLNTLEGGSLSVSLLIFSFGIILSTLNANAEGTDSAEEASKEAQALTYLIVLLNFGYLLYMTVLLAFFIWFEKLQHMKMFARCSKNKVSVEPEEDEISKDDINTPAVDQEQMLIEDLVGVVPDNPSKDVTSADATENLNL